MNKIKKIAVITGTRADYGLFYPLLKEIKKNPSLRLQLIVTSMHLLPEFGYTVKEIEKDGFRIDERVDMILDSDSGGAMAKSLAISVMGITQALERLDPSIVVVAGDRDEALAGAIATIHINKILAHIQGGDMCSGGSIDDSMRHAITKLAHIHFPATKGAEKRILQMGEEPWRVHMVGALGLDTVLNIVRIAPEKIATMFNLDIKKPIFLVLQNSVTTEADTSAKEMREIMEAIKELGEQTVVIYPNADAGGRSMIEVIKEYEKISFIQTYQNLPFLIYQSLLKVICVQIGNSSGGIIEAPALKIPVVHVGKGQTGRERSDNIVDVAPKKEDIMRGIKKALSRAFVLQAKNCVSPYGKGIAAPKIVEVLSNAKLDKNMLQKKFITL